MPTDDRPIGAGYHYLEARLKRAEKKMAYIYKMITLHGGALWDPLVESNDNPWKHPEDDIRGPRGVKARHQG